MIANVLERLPDELILLGAITQRAAVRLMDVVHKPELTFLLAHEQRDFVFNQ